MPPDSLPSNSGSEPTLRCRLFGHKWGAWIGGSWHVPNFGATHGALFSMAACKRCGLMWRNRRDAAPAGQAKAFEELVAEAKRDA